LKTVWQKVFFKVSKKCFFGKKFSTFATLTNWCFFSKEEKISNWSSVHKGGKPSSKANLTMRPKVPKHFPKGLLAYMVGWGSFQLAYSSN
jgi:hypothetical protein